MIRIIIAIAALAMTPSAAHAWGKTGHRVTGALAEAHLSADARAAIDGILDPGEDLAKASTWADFMRASDDSFWRREAGPYHYVTVPKAKTYAEVGAPKQGDAVTALARFRAVLRDETASRGEKALALRFAVHIIGDLHQPLHAGHGGDRGGNDFAVTFFGELTNLHSVWDSRMIDHEQLSYTEMAAWLAASTSEDTAIAWREIDPEVWIAESTAIRDQIYPEEQELAWRYVFDHKATYEQRLKMAGVRIAAYLNDVFAE